MYSNNNIKTEHHQDLFVDNQSQSSYTWDHQIRIPSYDHITVGSYPIEYTDSVFCHPTSMLSDQNNPISGTSNPSMHPKILNSHPPMTYTTGINGVRPRTVIASKRAAQNRAAQRAFRQRKERYIKDLERKAKLMDEWQAEMDQLRHQNKELMENSIRLEKQIHHQQQHIRHLENSNTNLELVSPINESNGEVVVPAPVVVYMDEPLKKHMDSTLVTSTMANSPTSTYSSSSSSFNGYEDSNYQPYQESVFWSTKSLHDMNSYETDFDLLPSNTKDEALNNLYMDLSTSQRPEEHRSVSSFYERNTNHPVYMSRAH